MKQMKAWHTDSIQKRGIKLLDHYRGIVEKHRFRCLACNLVWSAIAVLNDPNAWFNKRIGKEP